MTSCYCDCCQRCFTSLQYFSKHLNAPANIGCLRYYHANLNVTTSNEDVLPEQRPKKRRRMDFWVDKSREAAIEDAERVLQEEKEKELRRMLPKVDDIFEFIDDEAPEETRPRINLDLLQQATVPTRQQEDDSASDDDDSLCEERVGDDGVPHLVDRRNLLHQSHSKPNSSEMEQFKAYVEEANRENLPLTPEMKAAIHLMDTMNKKRGSIELYESVSKWRQEHSSSGDAGAEFISAKRLHEFLVKRYNLDKTMPKERQVHLPFCKETVSLTCFDARAQTIDLLTDPRLTDDAYLFFEDDPFSLPPEDVEFVGDINTGRAYRETYTKLIASQPFSSNGRRRVLLPFIFYLDGTVVGRMNQNLGLEIMKFTLGIFNGNVRTKPWAWRCIGHMKKLIQAKRRAEDNIRGSGHIDANEILPEKGYKSRYATQDERPTPDFDSSLYEENSNPRGNTRKRKRAPVPVVPVLDSAQDFHKMLQVLMASYKEIEDSGGIEWDHRQNNQVYELLYVPFIIFFKVDGKEGDKLCGQYTNKNEGVSCLCRSCCCPTKKSNDPYLDPPPLTKTPVMVTDLVRRKDWNGLKKLSQKPIWNATYELRFGQHDDTGVHGACPWEVLHWIQLNMFKYLREAFFLQTGESSILSNNIDTLCITMGELLKRQSDRNLPRTMFPGGIRVGMLQAGHMVGVMLVLALVIRSTQGSSLLLLTAMGKQKPFFATQEQVRNWSRLLETHLMFYSWLMQNEFRVDLVERAKIKVKEVLCMTRKVGQRSNGMGDNRSTFHGSVHVPESILNFGAPKHVHTECNEGQHVGDKGTAMKTQRRIETMDYQVGMKNVQKEAVELGMVEIETGRTRWQYYRRLNDLGPYDDVSSSDTDSTSPNEEYPVITGVKGVFYQRKDSLEWVMRIDSRSVDKNEIQFEAHVIFYLEEMARGLKGDNFDHNTMHNDTKIQVFTTLKVAPSSGKKPQLYYANPMDGGKPNYNWAQFQVDGGFKIGHMKAFIDFSDLPAYNRLGLKPGVHILMEPARRCSYPEEQRRSELFEPWVKDPCQFPPELAESHNLLLAVHIETLRLPSVVIPDLGNKLSKRMYLRMVPRWQWALMFEDWLEQPHRREWDD